MKLLSNGSSYLTAIFFLVLNQGEKASLLFYIVSIALKVTIALLGALLGAEYAALIPFARLLELEPGRWSSQH